MNIYHYHPTTGIFCGQSVADESPLEPGVFLIPAFATTLEPPQCPSGHYVVFKNSQWVLEVIPEPEPEPDPQPAPPPPTQEQLRKIAYFEEADPLFFKAQRGEITIDVWHQKVDEIRARYPYEVSEL
jgi:hypothetical protein